MYVVVTMMCPQSSQPNHPLNRIKINQVDFRSKEEVVKIEKYVIILSLRVMEGRNDQCIRIISRTAVMNISAIQMIHLG